MAHDTDKSYRMGFDGGFHGTEEAPLGLQHARASGLTAGSSLSSAVLSSNSSAEASLQSLPPGPEQMKASSAPSIFSAYFDGDVWLGSPSRSPFVSESQEASGSAGVAQRQAGLATQDSQAANCITKHSYETHKGEKDTSTQLVHSLLDLFVPANPSSVDLQASEGLAAAAGGHVQESASSNSPRQHKAMKRRREHTQQHVPGFDASLVRLLQLQEEHANVQMGGLGGEGGAPVFNAGHFLHTAHKHGVDPRTIAKRIMTVLSLNKPELLQRLTHAYGGRLPLNLLHSVAPYLKNHLHAMLMANYPPADVPLRMCSDFVFDGVHLTLVGFIAALVADAADEGHVTVPRGTVLVAPRFRVQTSQDGGANLTTELNFTDMASGGTFQSSSASFDDIDGLSGPTCSLSTLFARWPHLCRILSSASDETLAEAQAVMIAEAASRDVDTPDSIAKLYFEFLNGTGVACSVWISRAAGMYTSFVGQSEAFLRLTGNDHASIVKYATQDPDQDADNTMQIMHPSTLGRRTLAALTAANNKLTSYTFEGLHLRRTISLTGPTASNSSPSSASSNGTVSKAARQSGSNHTGPHAAAAARSPGLHDHLQGNTCSPLIPASVGGEASMHSSTPASAFASHGQRAAPGPSYSPEPHAQYRKAFYLPYCAMQTMHIEYFPSGKKRMDCLYLHDTVFTHQPVDAHAVPSAAGEVAALENVLLTQSMASEVKTAMRRSTNERGSRVGALEVMLATAVMDTKARLLKRLTMALSYESDPVLAQKLASTGVAMDSEAQMQGEYAPALNGLAPARLQRLRDGIVQQVSAAALPRIRALLAHVVQQRTQPMLLSTGSRAECTQLEFPIPAMRSASSRWLAMGSATGPISVDAPAS